MLKKSLMITLVCGLSWSGVMSAEAPSFIVVPAAKTSPKQSKNELKETLGSEIKQTLSTCAALIKEVARLQERIATIQEQLLAKGEELLENRPPFKKATSAELKEAVAAVEQSTRSLAHLKTTLAQTDVQKVPHQFERTVCLASTVSPTVHQA